MSFFWKRAKALAQIGCAFSLLSVTSGAANAQQIAATTGRLSAAAKANFETQYRSFQATKSALTPAQSKLSTALSLSIPAKKAQISRNFASFRGFAAAGADGRSDVIITGTITPNLLSAIARVGGQVVSIQSTSVRALISPAGAEQVAALNEVNFIRQYEKPRFNVGPKTTEGDITHAAAVTRDLFKIAGKGIKIGVMSDGVKTLVKAQADKELPPQVTVIANQAGVLQSGDGDEGTAMLEIVHDIAPDAQLYFASADGGQDVFADNIRRLRKAGCNVIVDDVIYPTEGVYQDGPVANAVTDVVADGALYFSSAGNQGSLSQGTSGTWDGQFRAGHTFSTDKGLAKVQMWGDDDSNLVTGYTFDAEAVLQWADPLDKSTNDYDMYVLDSNGNIISSSQDVQAGASSAFEAVFCETGDRIVVTLQSGEPRPLHLELYDNGALQVATEGSSYGHAASSSAIGVAAVSAQVFDSQSVLRPFTTKDIVEYFSSDGYRTYYFDATGKKKTYTVKTPVVAAADGVTTSVAGFERFYGTSAAAPHAAAIAALVWSYNLKQSAAVVKQALTSSALDIMSSSFDKNSGYGIVMADRALGVVAPPVMSISPLEVRGNEGDSGSKTFKVTVSISKAADTDLTVNYVTQALTAKSDVDFKAQSGTLTIPKGSKSVDVTFTYYGDKIVENDETFLIKFGKMTVPVKGGQNVTVTILDNDGKSATTTTKSVTDS